MSFKWMTAAVLTLGSSAFVPALAQANRFEDRDHDRARVQQREERVEHVERYERDRVIPRVEERRFEERRVVVREEPVRAVFVRVGGVDVPQCVLDTAVAEANGRSITSVQRVCTDGIDAYVLRACAPGKVDLSLSVSLDGRLLGVSHLG